MKENLMAKNPEEIKRNLLQAKNIAKQEGSICTSRLSNNGKWHQCQKMSEKSKGIFSPTTKNMTSKPVRNR